MKTRARVAVPIVSNGCELKRVERGKDAKLQEVLFAVQNPDASVTDCEQEVPVKETP